MESAKPRAELSDAYCYDLLRHLRWPDGVICPHCRERRVTTHTKSVKTPRRRYLCLACRRTFSDLTGTVFARTNLPLSKWLLLIGLAHEPRAVSDLARALAVKWDTTAHMQRRVMAALTEPGLVRQLSEASKASGGLPGRRSPH